MSLNKYNAATAAMLDYLLTLQSDTIIHINILPQVDGNAANWAGYFQNRVGELRYIDPETHQVVPWDTTITLPAPGTLSDTLGGVVINPNMYECYAYTDAPTLISAYTNTPKTTWINVPSSVPPNSSYVPSPWGTPATTIALAAYLAAPTAPQFYWYFNPFQPNLNMDKVRSLGAA